MRIVLIFGYLSLCCAWFLFSCQSNSAWSEEASALLAEQEMLNHRHKMLDQMTDSLWDFTTMKLEEAIPENFPAIDRDIFLNSRNADHIRMFQSFQLLDTGTQQLVNQAAIKDVEIADQLRALMEDKRIFEQKKNAFLMEVAQKDPAAQQKYADQFRSLATLK